MNLHSLPIALALLSSSAALSAESQPIPPDVPPPRPPWIAPVPERGQWEIRITDPAAVTDPDGNPESASGVNRLPVTIRSMTWNTVKRDIFEFTDGSTETLIYYAGYVLVEGKTSQGQPAPVLVQQLPGTDLTTLRASGWLGMDWLAEKFYVEPQNYRSPSATGESEPELCYHFRKPEGKGAAGEDWLPEMQAWIRVSDLQPMGLVIGSRHFDFQPLDPPTAAPQMTQEQGAKLLDLKDQNERLVRLRDRNKRLRQD